MKKSDSSDYSAFIWLGVIAVLLLLAYLRYRHLSKKGMKFPDICKNFIPVGAVISKFKPSNKADNYKLDGPQPEVMNGYLQKPTVGAAAAQAYRPVRSNTASAVTPSERRTSTPAAKTVTASSATVAAKTARPSRVNTTDPELHEMVLRQRELEQKMKEISSQKEKLPDIGDE